MAKKPKRPAGKFKPGQVSETAHAKFSPNPQAVLAAAKAALARFGGSK